MQGDSAAVQLCLSNVSQPTPIPEYLEMQKIADDIFFFSVRYMQISNCGLFNQPVQNGDYKNLMIQILNVIQILVKTGPWVELEEIVSYTEWSPKIIKQIVSSEV